MTSTTSREILSDVEGAEVNSETRCKRPNASWMPKPFDSPQGHKELHCPMVVLENGWNATSAKLERDMEVWLEVSEGRVKVVITIKATKAGGFIDQRRARNQENKQGRMVEETSLRAGRNKQPEQCRITGSLSIPFEACYLRERRADEADFILSNEMLIDIANNIQLGAQFRTSRV
ncbi:hypothetical protein N7532_004031 [Penicillium argentinense]|uniref:Uncharacterized protein n=1 Tax=Penicillium argentinense TaxID=1131581 RepID=A0A9W9KFR8_9EURO|nr:uncharacterized protein N7532_004031 [Penicillium argentinense]KAJ5103502.1 hypothetical protein N7532_004031 [Penicillium argentinense]